MSAICVLKGGCLSSMFATGSVQLCLFNSAGAGDARRAEQLATEREYHAPDGHAPKSGIFSEDYANSGTPNRPNIVPGQNILAAYPSGDELYYLTAFSTPAPYTFGDAGRDTLPGPGNAVVDLALHRKFMLGEHRIIEARAEIFNVLNHPNMGIPLPYPDFGTSFRMAVSEGNPQGMQFAMRYDF